MCSYDLKRAMSSIIWPASGRPDIVLIAKTSRAPVVFETQPHFGRAVAWPSLMYDQPWVVQSPRKREKMLHMYV